MFGLVSLSCTPDGDLDPGEDWGYEHARRIETIQGQKNPFLK
jgi:hypothetical protein